MKIHITKPVVFGMRFSTVNGGLGTTETHLPVGTIIVSIGSGHNYWQVVSEHLAIFFIGHHRYTASAKGRIFSTLGPPE